MPHCRGSANSAPTRVWSATAAAKIGHRSVSVAVVQVRHQHRAAGGGGFHAGSLVQGELQVLQQLGGGVGGPQGLPCRAGGEQGDRGTVDVEPVDASLTDPPGQRVVVLPVADDPQQRPGHRAQLSSHRCATCRVRTAACRPSGDAEQRGRAWECSAVRRWAADPDRGDPGVNEERDPGDVVGVLPALLTCQCGACQYLPAPQPLVIIGRRLLHAEPVSSTHHSATLAVMPPGSGAADRRDGHACGGLKRILPGSAVATSVVSVHRGRRRAGWRARWRCPRLFGVRVRGTRSPPNGRSARAWSARGGA